MDLSPKAPSETRVTVYFVLPRERASRSSTQRMRRFQLSSHVSHFSLLKAVRPEYPNGVSPFISFGGFCSWCHFPWFRFFSGLRWSLSSYYHRSLLMCARPERHPIRSCKFVKRCTGYVLWHLVFMTHVSVKWSKLSNDRNIAPLTY
jgi:hypothetical protein